MLRALVSAVISVVTVIVIGCAAVLLAQPAAAAPDTGSSGSGSAGPGPETPVPNDGYRFTLTIDSRETAFELENPRNHLVTVLPGFVPGTYRIDTTTVQQDNDFRLANRLDRAIDVKVTRRGALLESIRVEADAVWYWKVPPN
ncbi:hypothetical protein [Antrihabitans spumae]|uniref:Uncharacterized protein n=1 Tax=Antrihabitans spumae TaxID=3373370 RepID=A0ABW7KNC9_9NOCA